MRILSSLVLLLALSALLSPLGAAEATADSRRLTGSYHWNHGDETGALDVLFVPVGERKWEVSFSFSRGGRDYTYLGTAQGSLGEGTLSGVVYADSRQRRAFSFRCEHKGSTCEGTHSEGDSPFGEVLGTLKLGG